MRAFSFLENLGREFSLPLISFDVDARFFASESPSVVEGADHLANAAANATPLVNDYFHLVSLMKMILKSDKSYRLVAPSRLTRVKTLKIKKKLNVYLIGSTAYPK